jgi:PilZ domain
VKKMSSMSAESQVESSLDLHIEELIAGGGPTDFGTRTQERRQKGRIKEPFPARIWGIDSGDLPFNVDCILDNISSKGVYLKMPRPVNVGSEVRLIVHFLSGPTTGSTASLQGTILRDELLADGRHGLAIAISRHRFL